MKHYVYKLASNKEFNKCKNWYAKEMKNINIGEKNDV